MRERGYALLAILLVGLARLSGGVALGFRPFDDSYITFRYARNLSAGQGFVYNLNEWVLGTTTPLWTFVLAAFGPMGIPIEAGAMVFSLAADVATAMLILGLLRRLQYSLAVSTGAAILFLGTFDYFSLTRSGMETACFVLLIVASLWAIAGRRFGRAGALCGLACLARPEGIVVVGVLLISAWRTRHQVTRGELAAAGALLVTIVGSWAVYAIAAFGSVVPQSVMAKAKTGYGVAALVRHSWANLARFLVVGQPGDEIFVLTWLQLTVVSTILSAIAIAAILRESLAAPQSVKADRAVVLLVFPAAYVAGLALGHAFTYFPWYYGPVYPFSAMLTVIGVSRLVRRGTAIAVGISCAVLVVFQLSAGWFVKLPRDRSFWLEGYVQAARVIPRDQAVRVAACEIGVLGWKVSPSQVIDLVGLVTPGAAGQPGEAILRLTWPDYVVFRTDNRACALVGVARTEWFARDYRLVAAIPDPYRNREFRTYRITCVRLRAGGCPDGD